MRVLVIPSFSCETTKAMFGALKLSVVACLLIVCTADKCQHLDQEEAFPPDIRHQYFDDAYANQFDEIVVIGDVHGCYNELKLLLDKANITGDNVLKILAGDMTRKGPNSTQVLRYLEDTPSAVAVRGNNDQKVLMNHYDSTHSNYTLSRRDSFIKDLTSKDLDFLQQLPYTISIPFVNAIIVHAGIRPGVTLEDHDPFDLMNVRNLVKDENCAGGYRPIKGYGAGVPWASTWKGPQHVYFGHDHFRNLQLYPLATGVDTSCVNGKYLTGVFIKGPRTGKFVNQKALKKYVNFPSLEQSLKLLGKPTKLI